MKYLLALIFLTGCASTPMKLSPQAAPQVDQDDARATYMNCLMPYAKRLDDKMSDANTIAAALIGACPNEFDAVFETITRGDNNEVRRQIRARQGEMQQAMALRVVLDNRRASSTPKP